jgi:hypothetical protein|nr:MAG TPA: hypothetical protein [Crassvirales sp.]
METPIVQGAEQVVAVQPEVKVSDYDAIIKGIIAAGGKKIAGIRVKNANFTEKDNYTMVSFTLANKIRGYVRDEETGTYKEGLTNVVFTSLFAICGALKEDDEKAWIANHLLNHPTALPLLFAGSTIDLVQSEVPAGVTYRNPFSSRENIEGVTYDHDTIINNLIRIRFGKMGEIAASRLMDKMLDL